MTFQQSTLKTNCVKRWSGYSKSLWRELFC